MEVNMKDVVAETATLEKKSMDSSNDVISFDRNESLNDVNRQSKRMQELIEQVDRITDKSSRELMRDCLREILTFYGNGLERILYIIGNDRNEVATRIFNDLIEDSFVSGLLLIHDLHPFDLRTRLNLALEKVRPYIESHGGNIELVSFADDSAKIKLSGSCKTCA